MSLELLGAHYVGAKESKATKDAHASTDEEGGGWTAGRVLKYGLGGLAGALVLGWAFKHRGSILLESRTATRQVKQLAGRATSTVRNLGSEHRSIREGVASERQAAIVGKRMRKLETQLVAADRRVNEAKRLAEQKAAALQALRAAT